MHARMSHLFGCGRSFVSVLHNPSQIQAEWPGDTLASVNSYELILDKEILSTLLAVSIYHPLQARVSSFFLTSQGSPVVLIHWFAWLLFLLLSFPKALGNTIDFRASTGWRQDDITSFVPRITKSTGNLRPSIDQPQRLFFP